MSYTTWHNYGYGICVDDIKTRDVTRLESMLKLAPNLDREICQNLTMILKRKPIIPDETTAGLDTVGVRCPSHPVTLAIIREAGLNGLGGGVPEVPQEPDYPEPTRLIANYTTGDDVKWVQEKLQGLGYSLGSYGIDGKYGNTCEASVKQLQRDYGLSVDGIVGSDTRRALKGEIKKAVNPYRKPTQNIYLGDWGDGIRWVQYELKRRGYDIGAKGIDGQYGASTKAAVERFQRAFGLAVDGIVGPKTREALAS